MSLHALIARRIAQTGPITVADYIHLCHLHPKFGYYATRDPLGAAGDFVTAPEISQMFGELIGLALAQTWQDQGAPARFVLAELGPGRGTLMADVLRATRGVAGFHAALTLHLVEASEPLRARQATVLGAQDPHWHNGIETLPDGPLFLIANEFFDALPVRQFQRAATGWHERMIGLGDGQLTFGLSDAAPVAALAHRMDDTRPGDIVETCAPAQAISQGIGQRIADHGGAALIIDYGDWRSLGDTLQAVAGHTPVSALENPGQADLTTHVDFEALADAAPCRHTRLCPQGVFLERLGITARAQTLAQNMSAAARDTHIAAHRRLTHPDEMGKLFKVLGFFPDGAAPPPGMQT